MNISFPPMVDKFSAIETRTLVQNDRSVYYKDITLELWHTLFDMSHSNLPH